MKPARKQFDWQAIHRALEQRLSHLGSTVEDDPRRVEAMLRQRSIALAAVPRAARDKHQLTPALAFRLGQQRYALPLDRAEEVTGLARVAVIPGASKAVVGIVGWRGEFVVVFDMAQMFGLGATEKSAAARTIVLRGGEPRLALAVDVVDEVIRVDLPALYPADQLRARHAELFRGATPDAVLVLAEEPLLARLGQELRAA